MKSPDFSVLAVLFFFFLRIVFYWGESKPSPLTVTSGERTGECEGQEESVWNRASEAVGREESSEPEESTAPEGGEGSERSRGP